MKRNLQRKISSNNVCVTIVAVFCSINNFILIPDHIALLRMITHSFDGDDENITTKGSPKCLEAET